MTHSASLHTAFTVGEDGWPHSGDTECVRATVGPTGRLTGIEPQRSRDNPHVYRILFPDDRQLDTVAGKKTRVLYIGQGRLGRVNQLWSGIHSANIRLARARWAIGGDFEVVVQVRPDPHPELEELRLLNTFVGRHGQLPAFNGKFEGWMPVRLLQAVVAQLQTASSPPAFDQPHPYAGPKARMKDHSAVYTAIDLYGDPPEGKAWRWRGTLLWQWPDVWLSEHDKVIADQARAKGFEEGCFVLIGIPDTDKAANNGWTEVPPLYRGLHGWTAGSKARLLHPGDPCLGGQRPADSSTDAILTATQILTPVSANGLGPLAEVLSASLPVKGWDG